MTKCPYVPPHEFDVDFPHLMLRYRAVEAEKGRVPFTDRELTKTDRNGELAKFVAPDRQLGDIDGQQIHARRAGKNRACAS